MHGYVCRQCVNDTGPQLLCKTLQLAHSGQIRHKTKIRTFILKGVNVFSPDRLIGDTNQSDFT